ncbi:hypothetical protein [Leucobacter komagatae]|uniref:Uncharacterized protein n=1 Tax=Leucobacter komagatae TaxID=55969 RepID=A0A0D0HX62_9MICO|nr:hypothetical protein [Leucobacter komagatae]KIP52226.1 hypothetical protein SD72_10215 [Leucobacter komagatae]
MSITYEIEGAFHTVSTELTTQGCTEKLFWAEAPESRNASLLLNKESVTGKSPQISAAILADNFVTFIGFGVPEFSEGESASRAVVVEAPGTAMVSPAPAGENPGLSKIDQSEGVSVPATVTVTVDCLR